MEHRLNIEPVMVNVFLYPTVKTGYASDDEKACAEVGVYRVVVPVRSGSVDCLRPFLCMPVVRENHALPSSHEIGINMLSPLSLSLT